MLLKRFTDGATETEFTLVSLPAHGAALDSDVSWGLAVTLDSPTDLSRLFGWMVGPCWLRTCQALNPEGVALGAGVLPSDPIVVKVTVRIKVESRGEPGRE